MISKVLVNIFHSNTADDIHNILLGQIKLTDNTGDQLRGINMLKQIIPCKFDRYSLVIKLGMNIITHSVARRWIGFTTCMDWLTLIFRRRVITWIITLWRLFINWSSIIRIFNCFFAYIGDINVMIRDISFYIVFSNTANNLSNILLAKFIIPNNAEDREGIFDITQKIITSLIQRNTHFI